MRQRDGNQKDTPGSRAQGLVPRRGLVEVALLPGQADPIGNTQYVLRHTTVLALNLWRQILTNHIDQFTCRTTSVQRDYGCDVVCLIRQTQFIYLTIWIPLFK